MENSKELIGRVSVTRTAQSWSEVRLPPRQRTLTVIGKACDITRVIGRVALGNMAFAVICTTSVLSKMSAVLCG
jgi:hypothetical protein